MSWLLGSLPGALVGCLVACLLLAAVFFGGPALWRQVHPSKDYTPPNAQTFEQLTGYDLLTPEGSRAYMLLTEAMRHHVYGQPEALERLRSIGESRRRMEQMQEDWRRMAARTEGEG